MSDVNEWEFPTETNDAPPPPQFLNQSERDFAKNISDEISERVIGQQIVYFAIDTINTQFHPLYGEAINKVFLPPVQVYVMVEWAGLQTNTSDYGIDRKPNSINVHFLHRRISEDKDLFVREGDFIQYGSYFYEICTIDNPRELFGQNDLKVDVVATCIKARRGTFRAS